jgi:phospholipid/cholesterol/gamma-HCH transport system substrate-binding protein
MAILIFLVFRTGNFEVTKEGYEIKVLFNYIGGIRKNAPVRLCGMDVGKVKDIQIYYGEETQIVITLWLSENAKIRKDSKVYITTLGLMGEKYIEVTGGSKGMEFVEAGSTIRGEDPIQMEQLVSKGEEVAKNINMTLEDLRGVLRHIDDVITREEIDNIIVNLEKTSENFKEFSATLKRQPWRLIWKTREKKPKIKEEKKEKKEKGRKLKEESVFF